MDGRGAGAGRAAVAAGRRRRLLPLALPQPHAPRRGCRRCPPRREPRARRARRRPRPAGRRRGSAPPGRSSRPSSTVAVLLALPSPVRSFDAPRRARTGRGDDRRRTRRAAALQGRALALGALPRRLGRRPSRCRCSTAGALPVVVLASAVVVAGPRGHVPDRRADSRRHRAAVADAAAGAARDARHGAAERRRLGAARGRDGVGVRRGRPRRGSRRRHGRRLRRHVAGCEPAGRARPGARAWRPARRAVVRSRSGGRSRDG